MIDKIRKLLALASNNPNEEEAAVAMAKAQELMIKHGIEQDQLVEKKPGVVYGEKVEFDKWEEWACGAASAVCGTKALFYRSEGYFKFIGRPDNIQASAMLYLFICDQIEKLYKISLPKGMTQKERAMYRKSFKYAAASAVLRKAREIEQNTTIPGTSTELVVLHNQTLKDEIEDFLANVELKKPRAQKTIKLDYQAYQKGVIAGNSIRLQGEVK